jgi:O-acetyl-ADP-ribose deacetylase (regulator of RNase III)
VTAITLVRNGNIFNSSASALVNPVNCVGTAGAGLALAFKRRFPFQTAEYARQCRAGNIRIGRVTVIRRAQDRSMICFPTKQHWKDSSNLPDIELGLIALRKAILENDFDGVAVPALGCGLGGLDWEDVRPLIFHHLSNLNTPIEVYEPPLS